MAVVQAWAMTRDIAKNVAWLHKPSPISSQIKQRQQINSQMTTGSQQTASGLFYRKDWLEVSQVLLTTCETLWNTLSHLLPRRAAAEVRETVGTTPPILRDRSVSNRHLLSQSAK